MIKYAYYKYFISEYKIIIFYYLLTFDSLIVGADNIIREITLTYQECNVQWCAIGLRHISSHGVTLFLLELS